MCASLLILNFFNQVELARMHPENRHVRDKIRQQLQVLRDKGFLEFVGRGEYGVR